MTIVERSLFALTPGVPFYKDWWANQVLFWSVVIGMISVVLRTYTFYISPGLQLIITPCSPVCPDTQHSHFLSNWHWLGMGFGRRYDGAVRCMVRGVEVGEEGFV